MSGATAIAIVGAACRFDGAANPADLRRRLHAGEGLLRPLDDADLPVFGQPSAPPAAGLDPARLPAGWVKVGAVVPDIEGCDLERFGLSAREAALIDPQHRLFLELALEALEDAGRDPERIAAPIGVFGGAAFPSYLVNQLMPARDQLRPDDEFAVMIGNNKDHLAARVAFLLGLRGPAVNVQTACSTSLMAVHLACQSLLQGECDFALAGGVSLEIPQGRGYAWQAGGVLSPDGACRAFDADAAGTVPGNGGGMVLLRPLAHAERDGDRILAVIAASAANNDGAGKMAYTAPSVDGQAAVIAEALALAGIEPAAIGYVEAHGTGTALGDPIEVAALREVFGERSGPPCWLGSVKTHLGHCDAAAGVAGLLAAALAVESGEVAGVRNFRRPNPRIDFGPFRVPEAPAPWPAIPGPRRAGVSSFGIGGTNVHLVLEEAPPRPAPPASRGSRLFLLAAATPGALQRQADQLAGFLRIPAGAGLDPADVAATLAEGRVALGRRRALLADGLDDLTEALVDPRRFVDGSAAAGRHGGRRVVFLLPGQGAQRPGMAAGLERWPIFEAAFTEGLELLRQEGIVLGPLLRQSADDPTAADELRHTVNAQCSLVVLALALAEQWRAWGVKPAGLLGHSVGELAGAGLAGVFDKKTLLSLVAERGRLLAACPPGGMSAVALPDAELSSRLAGSVLEIAAINGPRLCTVAGPLEALSVFENALSQAGIENHRMRTAHAFHTAAVESALAPFRRAVAAARPKEPRLPLVSNVSGTWLTAAQATDPDYWASHLRKAVRFADGLATLRGDQPLALELGPTALTSLARQAGMEALASLPGSRQDFGPPLPPDADAGDALLMAAGRAFTAGVSLDARALDPERRVRVALPTYAFERRRCWIEPAGDRPAVGGELVRENDSDRWLYLPTWTRVAPPEPSAAARLVRHWLVADPADPRQQRLADALDLELARRGVPCSRQLPALGAEPLRVIFLGALAEAAGAATVLQRALEVVRAAAPFAPKGVALVAVVDRLHDVVAEEAQRPEQAVLIGPWRVAPQELPGATSLLVDVDLETGEARALASAILDLAALPPPAGGAWALRGSRAACWRAGYEKLERLPESFAWPERPVVAITGGFGRIGRSLARRWATARQGQVLLVGRQPADPERLREAEKLTAEHFATAFADVAAPGELAAALAAFAARHGRIDVIVHAAGVTGDQAHTPLAELGDDDRERHFAPKVAGGAALEAAVAELRAAGTPLGCVLLCSSLSTVLGGLGFGAYAGANAYLDALAGPASRRTGVPFLAVDWDGWQFERGPAVGAAALGLELEAGLELFDRLPAAAGLGRLVVSTADLAARQARWGQSAAPPKDRAPTTIARPGSAPDYQEPITVTERRLAAIWAEVLGFSPIGTKDNFFELGGHSLLATQLVSRVRENLATELPMAAIFDHPTLGGLAGRLDALAPRPDAAEEREEIEL